MWLTWILEKDFAAPKLSLSSSPNGELHPRINPMGMAPQQCRYPGRVLVKTTSTVWFLWRFFHRPGEDAGKVASEVWNNEEEENT